MTLEQVAAIGRTDHRSINRYERGKRTPEALTIYALASIYAKPLEWFYEEDFVIGNQEEEVILRPTPTEKKMLEKYRRISRRARQTIRGLVELELRQSLGQEEFDEESS